MGRKRARAVVSSLGFALGLVAGHPLAAQDAAHDPASEWQQPTAPKNAPNVILILLDDVGFGAAGAFGGPIATPAFDKLAEEGLRYNRFHTTAVCSPTRAALLTGRNQHRVGFGYVSGQEKPHAGYTGIWPKSAASIAQVLKDNGYSTAAFGKWHNTPNWEASPVGPFDRWPTGLGFEYFYGFMGGEADQWQPILYRNTVAMTAPETGYNFNVGMANDAIGWLHTHQSLAPGKPYFLYYAPGATHAPHQVGPEWIAKYRGRFDDGWDAMRKMTFERQKRMGVIPKDAKLTERPAELPAWNSLSEEARKLYARQMEVYAGFLEQTDYEIGRMVDAARAGPGGENTMVIYIMGDNGASAEGGMNGSDRNLFDMITESAHDLSTQSARMDELGSDQADNHFSAGWAWASDAPFQWTKQIASHLGGVRNPMVISWPGHIAKAGQVRSAWTHVIDVAPTLYDIIGIKAPDTVNGVKQISMDGISFAATFKGPVAEKPRTQYFEMQGNRGVYSNGWMASARHHIPWLLHEENKPFSEDKWELYNLDKDFSQATDLATRYPEKLKAMQALFESEAKRNNAEPLATMTLNSTLMNIQPSLERGRKEFVYKRDTAPIPSLYGMPMLIGPHRIDAKITVPEADANGVIASNGARDGGFTLYLKDGYLVYENNLADVHYDTIRSAEPLPAGPVTVSFVLSKDDKTQVGHLLVNGEEVGETPIPHIFMPSYLGAFCVGQNCGSPVGKGYTGRFPFTGDIEEVRISR
ncbi:arylsulfatase [Croceicoccus estronivorus]|uniref:arylsulfatase n=1 Tax=Croceicoccus estronivorus TaxID=1172626 RepID=UPI00082E1876|nr:arylsulfatase [Croceicoccus estronivorus]OCC25600.1 arylsulfatase [Croceicoccus estronivorus]